MIISNLLDQHISGVSIANGNFHFYQLMVLQCDLNFIIDTVFHAMLTNNNDRLQSMSHCFELFLLYIG